MYINGDGYFVDFSELESSFDCDQNVLRIVYRSDSPTRKDIKKFIKQCYPTFEHKRIKKVYFDPNWVYTEDGNPYGIILVFY